MTASNFAEMTDAELNAEAARRMGWRRGSYPVESPWWLNKDGGLASYLYNPAESIHHAAELGAAFLAAFKKKHGEIGACIYVRIGDTIDMKNRVVIDGSEVAVTTSGGVGLSSFTGASEARARTVAVLQAWDALGGGE